ncbi:MAG: nitrile hydratase accessory protein [Bacteriovorax sp.]|nr:nitrile hydratase accessory protein [Rhizobacter sp.]
MAAGGAGKLTAPASALLARSLPVAGDADVKFAEPWEAKAFAIIVEMSQAGHFSWSDWVDCFSKEVAAADALEAAGVVSKTYYEQWLNAAETLLIEKGITSKAQLQARRFAMGVVGSTHAMK